MRPTGSKRSVLPERLTSPGRSAKAPALLCRFYHAVDDGTELILIEKLLSLAKLAQLFEQFADEETAVAGLSS